MKMLMLMATLMMKKSLLNYQVKHTIIILCKTSEIFLLISLLSLFVKCYLFYFTLVLPFLVEFS